MITSTKEPEERKNTFQYNKDYACKKLTAKLIQLNYESLNIFPL